MPLRDVGMAQVAGHACRVGVQAQQRTVVVEHLLEVRDRPFGIDAVAAEASAELVVDSPFGHALERDAHDVERVGIAYMLGPHACGCRRSAAPRGGAIRALGRPCGAHAYRCAQAEREVGLVRELGRAAETAVHRVERRLQRFECERRRPRGQRAGSGRLGLEARECIAKTRAVLGDRRALLAISRSDAREELEEPGQSVAPFAREVRAAEERRPLGRQEHRERPAAGAAREERVRGLVDLVEIGPLLAIDLDVHEVRVHRRRDDGILERLVGHHVAPVARRVADRQQDWLALAPRKRQRRLAPRLPVDRIVRVLQEIRACLAREAVGHAAPAPRSVSPIRRTRRARSRRRAGRAGSAGTAAPDRNRASAECGSD